MAIVKLDKVTVSRLDNNGHGYSVLEENTSGGKTYKQFFKVWAKEPHGLNVGDVVSVSGFLAAKVGEPKTGNDGVERRYVELGVNSPRIDGQGATGDGSSPSVPASVTQAGNGPQTEPWGQQWTGEEPF